MTEKIYEWLLENDTNLRLTVKHVAALFGCSEGTVETARYYVRTRLAFEKMIGEKSDEENLPRLQ